MTPFSHFFGFSLRFVHMCYGRYHQFVLEMDVGKGKPRADEGVIAEDCDTKLSIYLVLIDVMKVLLLSLCWSLVVSHVCSNRCLGCVICV